MDHLPTFSLNHSSQGRVVALSKWLIDKEVIGPFDVENPCPYKKYDTTIFINQNQKVRSWNILHSIKAGTPSKAHQWRKLHGIISESELYIQAWTMKVKFISIHQRSFSPLYVLSLDMKWPLRNRSVKFSSMVNLLGVYVLSMNRASVAFRLLDT